MRPHLIQGLIQNIDDTTDDYHVYVVATGVCAETTRPFVGPRVSLIEDNGGTYPVRINLAASQTNEPFFLLAADDLKFHNDWLLNAMRIMETIDGVVAVNDLHNMAGVHFLVSRSYINQFGGFKDAPVQKAQDNLR